MSLEVSKLFVGGLPYDMDEKRLAEVFVQFGTVMASLAAPIVTKLFQYISDSAK